MPNYRRAFIPGGTWFFTVNLLDRGSSLLTENITRLGDAIRDTQTRFPFTIDAMVVLPDHLHAVLTLPEDDPDFSTRWRLIKTRFSKTIPATELINASRHARAERAIWQRRYWEHCIRDERDRDRHIDYCYINPVKHGLVAEVEDWPHSTFHRDVRRGYWLSLRDIDGDFGETR